MRPRRVADVKVSMLRITPKFQHLYFCRYGFNGGRQICLFLGCRGDGFVVRKWRKNSARWTDEIVINKNDLVGIVTRTDIAKAGVQIKLKD